MLHLWKSPLPERRAGFKRACLHGLFVEQRHHITASGWSYYIRQRRYHLARTAMLLYQQESQTLGMNRSLFTTRVFFLPFPDFGTSVQISFTFSRILESSFLPIQKYMLQCLSNAFTWQSNLWLLRTLISTYTVKKQSKRLYLRVVLDSIVKNRQRTLRKLLLFIPFCCRIGIPISSDNDVVHSHCNLLKGNIFLCFQSDSANNRGWVNKQPSCNSYITWLNSSSYLRGWDRPMIRLFHSYYPSAGSA